MATLLLISSSLRLSLRLTSTTITCLGLRLSCATRFLVSVLLCGVVILLTLLALRAKLQSLQDPRDADLVGLAPLLFLDNLGPDCGQLESREVHGGKDCAAEELIILWQGVHDGKSY